MNQKSLIKDSPPGLCSKKRVFNSNFITRQNKQDPVLTTQNTKKKDLIKI